LLTWV
jgi:[ribosomal protein S5]-alanine N-acetyltransferase